MPSVNRDIAKILGRTEAANPDNVALGSGSGLTVYATPNLLPTSGFAAGDQAFVTSNNRIYISNGSGWYNVALINSTPTFTSGPAGSYALATDLTPTVITLVAQDSDGQVVTYSGTPSGMDGIATLSQDSSVFTVTPLTDSAGGNIGSFTITFQATDGVGIASEVSTFTLSFGPDWSATPTVSTLVATDAQTGDVLGFGNGKSGNISGDGTYYIVGAENEDGGAGDQIYNAGAAYVFVRSGSTWTQQAKLTAPSPANSRRYGYTTSINSDGTFATVTELNYAGNYTGAVHVYGRSGSTWTFQTTLTGLEASDQFGINCSISGDGMYIAAGADGGDNVGNSISGSGEVRIFKRSGSDWTGSYTTSTIYASDAQASDQFGRQVFINPDATYAIVGAGGEDGGAGDPLSNAGAAYVFTRSGDNTWTEQAILRASDAQANDTFGRTVAINSDATYAIVGANGEDGGAGDPISGAGAAYVFMRSGSTWTQQAILRASDAQAGDAFGGSGISIMSDGSHVVICAQGEDGGDGDPISGAGAAYVFSRSGSTWTQQRKLVAPAGDQVNSGNFGVAGSMSSDGNYIAIAQYGINSNTGKAYIYEAG